MGSGTSGAFWNAPALDVWEGSGSLTGPADSANLAVFGKIPPQYLVGDWLMKKIG